MSYLSLIENDLRKVSTKQRVLICSKFFRTGKGEYGEGDIFLGATVPDTRKIVKKYLKDLTPKSTVELLKSEYHEMRFAGLVALVEMMKRSIKTGDDKTQKEIFEIYLKNTKRINNWDLVDVSSPQIVGYYISEKIGHKERLAIINKLIESKNLWENRIVILATFYQIRKGDERMLYYVAEKLLNHKHDLIHKAIGWMLREVGKNCGIETLNFFLEKHKRHMSRITLRYALERHHPFERAKFLAF